MLKPILSLILAPCALVAMEQAQISKLATESDLKQLVEKVMNKFVSENYKGGFDLLSPHWKMPSNEIDTLLMQTITQRSAVKPRYGASLGHEFVSKSQVGSSFIRFVYIEKLQNTALRYTFVFYRPKDSWEFQAMLWDDKINLLFGE